jgi:hypothetical protein
MQDSKVQDEQLQDDRDTKFEDDATTSLSAQLTLNQTQSEQIKSILSNYRNSVSGANVSEEAKITAQEEADAAISAVLDDGQASLYSGIKANWWNEVNAGLTDDSDDSEMDDQDTY